jgi:hypothetical protein
MMCERDVRYISHAVSKNCLALTHSQGALHSRMHVQCMRQRRTLLVIARMRCSIGFTFALSGTVQSLCAGIATVALHTATSMATSTISSSHFSYDAAESIYTPIPSTLQLRTIAVIARHGDRTPITRNIPPYIIDSASVRSFWSTRLPDAENTATFTQSVTKEGPGSCVDDPYLPYSQLTARGVTELQSVGVALRRRLVNLYEFLSPHLRSEQLYLRATNFRRAQHSLQNMLLGLYPLETRRAGELPVMLVRDRKHETMFPNAGGMCFRHDEIIRELEESNYRGAVFDGADELERDVRRLLGQTTGRIKWQQVREVLTCHVVHGQPLPEGVNFSLVDKITDYSAWIWGRWFVRARVVWHV